MTARLNPESLRYAQAVAETGSFSAAARAHGVTQPTLSNGIARLEQTLGEALFHRSTRGATPTEFGRRLLPLIDRALQGLDAVSAEARRWTAPRGGRIRVGVSPLIDPKLIATAHRAANRVGTSRGLVLREANLAELREALAAAALDLIMIPSVAPLPRYEHRSIGSERVVLVDAGSGTSEPIGLSELADRQLILVPDACGLTTFTRDLLAAHDVPMRTYPGEAQSYQVLEEWSMLGIGAAVLPASRAARAAPRPIVDEDGLDVEIFYEAVWDPHSPIAAELAEFVELLQGGERQQPLMATAT